MKINIYSTNNISLSLDFIVNECRSISSLFIVMTHNLVADTDVSYNLERLAMFPLVDILSHRIDDYSVPRDLYTTKLVRNVIHVELCNPRRQR